MKKLLSILLILGLFSCGRTEVFKPLLQPDTELQSVPVETIDICTLPPGVYFLSLELKTVTGCDRKLWKQNDELLAFIDHRHPWAICGWHDKFLKKELIPGCIQTEDQHINSTVSHGIKGFLYPKINCQPNSVLPEWCEAMYVLNTVFFISDEELE